MQHIPYVYSINIRLYKYDYILYTQTYIRWSLCDCNSDYDSADTDDVDHVDADDDDDDDDA